jgi:putative peptidoglycan lipid II flippase
LVRSASSIGAAVFLSRILGLVRESLFASLFGAQFIADAFVIAFRIPNLLRDLFAEGVLASALVPALSEELVHRGRDRAFALTNLVITSLAFLTGIIALLGISYAGGIVDAIAPGFDANPDKRTTAIQLTRIMMPFLPLVSCAAALMSVLNSLRRFVVPALAPAVFNVGSILIGFYLYVAGYPPSTAIVGWSIGVICSGTAQLLIQVPTLWSLGWKFRPAVRGIFRHEGVRRIIRLATPAIFGLAAVQINIFVNSIFASRLGDGPVAQLNYAFRLFYLPLGLFGVSVATVTMTSVAHEAARGATEQLVDRLAEGLRATWIMAIPSMLGLMAIGIPTVRLIYERGAFTASDTSATAAVLFAYLVGLAPYCGVKVLAPAYYALNRVRIPLVGSILAVATNISFNWLTYRSLGAPGIALGTALGATVNILVLRCAIPSVIGSMKSHRIWLDVVRITVAASVAAAAALGMTLGIGQLANGESLSGAARQIFHLLSVAVPIAVAVALYFPLCRVLGVTGIEEFVGALRTKFLRRSA